MNILVTVVMVLVLLVTIAIWSVVGLVFWIPLLVRATTVFSAALLPAAFSGRSIAGVRAGLEDASGFYFRGFVAAFDVFRGVQRTPNSNVTTKRVVVESVWTIVFWLLAIYFVRPAILTPLIHAATARLAE